VDFQAGMGCQQEVLDREGCIAREPALRHCTSPLVGGVWTADECVGDPHLLARGLAQSLQALGGECRFGTRVTAWATSGDRVLAAHTEDNNGRPGAALRADAFVLAAGPAAAALARELGLYLPICPIKGYSLTLSFLPGAARPSASVTDLSRKTVFAPLAGRLRVAAMAEIGDNGLSTPSDRVQHMLDSVQAVFPGLADLQGDPAPWAGLRPATPSSVPIVGPAPRWSNLWLDVGHGALGLTLAAGSAQALAEQIGRRAHP
jgi:D-amino-acid dehydrogenase